MKSIFNHLISLNFLVTGVVVAKPVTVILEAPKEIIQYHTPALSLGIKYESGAIIGGNFLSSAELKSGLMEKVLHLSDTEKVVSCVYSWMLSASSIGGSPDPVLGKVGLPQGFKGIVESKCNVDLEKSQIVLSISPFKLEKLEVHVPTGSLANRKAKALIAIVSPTGERSEKFENFSIRLTELEALPFTRTSYYLSREPMLYKVQAYWTLKAGGLEKEEKVFKDGYLEIR